MVFWSISYIKLWCGKIVRTSEGDTPQYTCLRQGRELIPPPPPETAHTKKRAFYNFVILNKKRKNVNFERMWMI